MFYENYQPVVDKTINDSMAMENTLGLPKARSIFFFLDNRMIEIDSCVFLKTIWELGVHFFFFKIQINNYFGKFTCEPESPNLKKKKKKNEGHFWQCIKMNRNGGRDPLLITTNHNLTMDFMKRGR